jgi:hypothetical protein
LGELLTAKARNLKAARVNDTSAVIQLSLFFETSLSLDVDNATKRAHRSWPFGANQRLNGKIPKQLASQE